jgi:glycosyltransferase involved in cell wall biosynthesis
MKVLYVSNHRDGTGWGNAAQHYILALDAVGVEVVPRAIKLNDRNAEVPQRILELEQQDDRGCDVVIQHVLPHLLDYRGEFDQNIALYFTETDNFRRIGWQNNINVMDKAIVSCNDSHTASLESGVEIPIGIIPVSCDPSRYAQRWEPLQFPELNDKFVFYFVGEVTRRKNLVALLKAFHLEFDTHEEVGLLLKVSYPGLSPTQCAQKVTEMSNDVKKQLKKFHDNKLYKGEVILSQELTNNQMMQLHATGDCFVMPSFGEAWCMPAFDAMAMGKTPICAYQGGPSDYVYKVPNQPASGWLVDGMEEPCFGMADSAVPQLYTGTENWYNIDVNSLRYCMRQAFEDDTERKERAANGIDRAYDFTYEIVGKIMEEFINGKSVLPDRPSKVRKNNDCSFISGPLRIKRLLKGSPTDANSS